MKITCLCPTYNRVPAAKHLIEEAIESFLRQDYPDKELLILNDNPAQTLRLAPECDAPGVVIINTPRRFATLGEKYNAMVAMSDAKLFAPWEDDDISLSWRLSLTARALAVTGASYYNPRRYWFMLNGKYRHDHPMGVGHACSLYTRNAYEKVRGYGPLSGAQDSEFDDRLRRNVHTVGSPEDKSIELDISKWFYISRWDTGSEHLSYQYGNEANYRAIGQSKFEPGEFTLRPHWREDYEQGVKDTLCALS